MAAPTVVQIWNRALQLLGAARVQSTTSTVKNAQACKACYEPVRDSVLSQHPWRCAIRLTELAADTPDPTWGRAKSYTLPSDFLSLVPDYPEDNNVLKDFEIQDGKIYTDDTAPVYLRYVAKITDPVSMPPTLRELIAAEMAGAMCEELTQSNQKKIFLFGPTGESGYIRKCWDAAKRANSRLVRPQEPPMGGWERARWFE